MIVVWSEVVASVFPSLNLSFVNRFASKDSKAGDDAWCMGPNLLPSRK